MIYDLIQVEFVHVSPKAKEKKLVRSQKWTPFRHIRGLSTKLEFTYDP
jgi:hypothetical protein